MFVASLIQASHVQSSLGMVIGIGTSLGKDWTEEW